VFVTSTERAEHANTIQKKRKDAELYFIDGMSACVLYVATFLGRRRGRRVLYV